MNSRFCHLARDTLDLHRLILFCHLIIYSSMYLWIYLLETSLTVQSKNSRTSFIDSFLWSLAWHFRLSLVCGNLKPWHLDRHRLKTSNKQFSRAFLPGPSRRLAPVIKCNAFLCFHSYIVRDISLTEIYRWLVTFIEILSAILKSTRYGGESRERL